MNLQGKNGYRVWNDIDKIALEKEIENRLQYKVANSTEIMCIFSIQFNDPLIWRLRDKNDAIYLHRIVTHPEFRGQKIFAQVLHWAIQFARQRRLQCIRMDTWSDNQKIIDYYLSFGFTLIEHYKTTNSPDLPVQNRNLDLALLEMNVGDD